MQVLGGFDFPPLTVQCPTNSYQIKYFMPISKLSSAQIKSFRAVGHQLTPIVTLGEQGPSEGVMNELERALHDHELIKIKINIADREVRAEVLQHIASQTRATLVQSIGKTALLFRRNPQATDRLSNLARHGLK